MSFEQFITPELLILIPVLYIIGAALKKSNLNSKYIPLILGGISILICAMWVLPDIILNGWRDVLTAAFTAITQGVLLAGASVYANQIYKQSKEEK